VTPSSITSPVTTAGANASRLPAGAWTHKNGKKAEKSLLLFQQNVLMQAPVVPHTLSLTQSAFTLQAWPALHAPHALTPPQSIPLSPALRTPSAHTSLQFAAASFVHACVSMRVAGSGHAAPLPAGSCRMARDLQR
jgi:hypothetical protein